MCAPGGGGERMRWERTAGVHPAPGGGGGRGWEAGDGQGSGRAGDRLKLQPAPRAQAPPPLPAPEYDAPASETPASRPRKRGGPSAPRRRGRPACTSGAAAAHAGTPAAPASCRGASHCAVRFQGPPSRRMGREEWRGGADRGEGTNTARVRRTVCAGRAGSGLGVWGTVGRSEVGLGRPGRWLLGVPCLAAAVQIVPLARPDGGGGGRRPAPRCRRPPSGHAL